MADVNRRHTRRAETHLTSRHGKAHTRMLDFFSPEVMPRRIGWLVSGLVALFLGIDGLLRALRLDDYVEGLVRVGYPEQQTRWIGLILLVSTIAYLIPRTAAIGAILITGYLGGAIATQVRVEDFGPVVFAAFIAVMAWMGLSRRDPRVRTLLLGDA